MSPMEWLHIALYLGVLIAYAKPLGTYMAAVYQGATPGPMRWRGPLERLIYRMGGVRADAGMNWKQYAVAMILFHLVGFVALYGLQRAQALLPLNPAGRPPPIPSPVGTRKLAKWRGEAR